MTTRYVIFIVILFFIMFGTLFSTTWLVNKDPDTNPDFTEVQDAHTAAANGDTILVEGTESYFSQLTVTKQLHIFGPGYFLDENPETQDLILVAHINFLVSFNAGSEGSVFSGFTVHDIDVNTSNITISRNVALNNSSEIDIGGNLSNVIIDGNYIWSRYGALTVASNSSGIIIRNNYLEDITYPALSLNSTASVTIYNNVIDGDIVAYNSTLNNNILLDGTFTGTGNIYNNNLANSTQFGTSNGNQANIIMANVFVGLTGNSTDGQWQLQPGSPAIGAGLSGEDCGMFGGSTPYVLSGLPPLPAIFYLNTSGIGTTTGGLKIHIKTKINN